jgi:chemotaxis protein methyltransferase CheR
MATNSDYSDPRDSVRGGLSSRVDATNPGSPTTRRWGGTNREPSTWQSPHLGASTPESPYAYLRNLVSGLSQNVLDSSRDYLFDTRLSKLLRNEGLNSLDELVWRLRSHRNPSLENAIAEAMTINETSFFRDVRPFDLLRNELLPQLIEARRHTRALRFWSAACSTGQEAYSLAMTLLEYFPMLAGWDLVIEGTDLSGEVVERARAGRYHRIEINRGLPARFIVRYFDRTGEDWMIKPEVRSLCKFRQGNLCGPTLPFRRASDRFDVIFLRNVMLYFSMETRRNLLAGIHRLLAPDSVLFLGSSEQPADPSLWTPILASGTCYYRPR